MANEKLLNNEHMHDVVFFVGKSAVKMFGHKLILSIHNDFFQALVSSQFDDSVKGEFTIPDIEPEIFMEVLRFAYCETANITVDNFGMIYRAADKYLMENLKDFCLRSLKNHSISKIFMENQTVKFAEVENACIEAISTDPLQFFGEDHFRKLSKKALILICNKLKESRCRYCSYYDICSAIDKWFMNNEDSTTKEEIDSLKLSMMNVKKIKMLHLDGSSSNLGYFSQAYLIKFRILKPSILFGFGINSNLTGSAFRINIEIYNTHPAAKQSNTMYEFDLRSQPAKHNELCIKKIRLETTQELRISIISPGSQICLYNSTKIRDNPYLMYISDNTYTAISKTEFYSFFEYFLIED